MQHSSFFKGKRVFITGADGFIGSHLAEVLAESGAKVRAMVQYNSFGTWGNLEFLPKSTLSSIEIFPGDVRDPFSVDRGVTGCDVVFHLAALIAIPYSYQAPQSYVETNVSGTVNVLQASLRHGVSKVVNTSTSETYGTAMYRPIDEKHPLQGQSPYSASKIGADKMAESYFLSFNAPVATIRPFNTFGPRQSARAVIPTIISQIASGSREVKLGSLTPLRDFTFVLDTVAGFLAVAESDKSVGEVINVGSGKSVSIGDLAKLIVELMGKTKEVTITGDDGERVRPDKSEVMELLCNYAKATELCQWQPRHSLKEGLLNTISFVEKNLHRYKADIYNV